MRRSHPDRRAGTWLLLAIACLTGLSCGRAADQNQSSDPFPPPRPPAPASNLSLGAVLTTNAPGWAGVLPNAGVQGALVLAVLPGSPAERSGLVPGDVIVSIDRGVVEGAEGATRVLRAATESRRTLSFESRDGRRHIVESELEPARRPALAYLEQRLVRAPDTVTRYLVALLSDPSGAALPITQDLVRSEPDFAEGFAVHARTLLAALRRDGGKADVATTVKPQIQRALELDPLSGEVFASAARLLLDLGEPEAAEDAASQATVNNPGSATAHHLRGIANLRLGRPALALPDLHRAVELDPYAPELYADLASGYAILGQESSARATEQARSVLLAGGARSRLGSEARQVVLTASAVVMFVGVPLLLRGRRPDRRPKSPNVRASTRGPDRSVLAAEALGVLGLWSIAIPYAGPAFGLAPPAAPGLEIADHVIPGIVVAVASVAIVMGSLSPGPTTPHVRLLPAIIALAGLWTVSSHVGLVVQAAQQDRPWGLALFHSFPGPPILILAVVLHVLPRRRSHLPSHSAAGAVTPDARSARAQQ